MLRSRLLILSASLCLGVLLMMQATAFSQESAEKQSLYSRLGGLAPISVVVSDLIDALEPVAHVSLRHSMSGTPRGFTS